MFNKVILMGRLVADPELKQTQSGLPMCRFRIAVDRGFTKGEERQADFFNVVAWRQTAEFISRYFSKGKMIIVEGKVQNDNYTDQQGVKHFSCQIIADNCTFGESKSASEAHNGYNGNNYQNGGYPNQGGSYQNGGYQNGGNNYQNGGYSNGGYNANPGYNNAPPAYAPAPAPMQPAPAPMQPPVQPAQPAPASVEVGDVSDFEEILSDGDVPF
jgi:single-strand DNA-binding protein